MDAAVLDEVLGRSADDVAVAGTGHRWRDPARPRPLAAAPGRSAALCRSSGLAPTCAPRSRRSRARSASCPRWAGSTPGHVSLVERARAESATVVVSIFVNPRQFGERERLREVPAQRGARPRGVRGGGRRHRVRADRRRGLPAGLRHGRVGRARSRRRSRARRGPGHFDGVATVVAILFALVGAERAYFGAKDYQQVQVIRRMALDLALPTEVVHAADRPRGGRPGAVVTQRPALAGGSRGGAGHPSGARWRAPRCVGAGEREAGDASAQAMLRGMLGRGAAGDDRSTSRSRTPDTLAELDRLDGRALLSLAVRIDGVRLIDNERARLTPGLVGGRRTRSDGRRPSARGGGLDRVGPRSHRGRPRTSIGAGR